MHAFVSICQSIRASYKEMNTARVRKVTEQTRAMEAMADRSKLRYAQLARMLLRSEVVLKRFLASVEKYPRFGIMNMSSTTFLNDHEDLFFTLCLEVIYSRLELATPVCIFDAVRSHFCLCVRHMYNIVRECSEKHNVSVEEVLSSKVKIGNTGETSLSNLIGIHMRQFNECKNYEIANRRRVAVI